MLASLLWRTGAAGRAASRDVGSAGGGNRPSTALKDAAPPAPPPRAGSLPPGAAGAAAIISEDERTSPDGLTVRRTRIVRTDFKYPLLRVTDTWRVDPATGTREHAGTSRAVADHVAVRLRPGATEDDLRALCRSAGCAVRRRLPLSGLYLVAFDAPEPDSVERYAAALAAAGEVVRDAQPDYIMTIVWTLPDDPGFGNLWGLHNTGQSGGTADADIDAPEAWDVATGSGAVVAGIVDTGIDAAHPDLAANIWTNPGEIPGNGLDDDGNGYADDVRGWDFYQWDNNPQDGHGHGTHVAGTIGAAGSNGVGVAGVNWSIKLMALKAFGGSDGTDSDVTEAIAYATWMATNGVKVRVTNNSYGAPSSATYVYDAVAAAGDAGMLFIAAAGNTGGSIDAAPQYPASYALPHVIAVAATDRNDNRSSFSSYGAVSVDLGAPGSDIYSTLPGGGYGNKSGTSMACPHVVGAAALLWDLNPDWDYARVRDALFAGVDQIASLTNKTVTHGRLNVSEALRSLRPDITHAPATNMTNLAGHYAIEAAIGPAAVLDTNRVRVAWNLDGGAGAFATNWMTRVSNDLFRALLPTQAAGSVVHYFIRAESANGKGAAAHPQGAPQTLHAFRVVEPVGLWVAGDPDDYGAADPAYGYHQYPSGLTINASVAQWAPESEGVRWRNDGWTGLKDVPATGATAAVAFRLGRSSTLIWRWQRQFRLTQTSGVPGIVNATSWWDEGQSAHTVTAAPSAAAGGTNYFFAGWSVDGVRAPDPSNTAVNPVTGIAMPAPRAARASYLEADLDADGDGLRDWWEHFYFGGTSVLAAADSDGDGADNFAEHGDRSDPRNSNSVPAAPSVAVQPLADPQARAAPFAVSAAVADAGGIASVTLYWSRTNGSYAGSAMAEGSTGGIYTGWIPAPGTNGDSFSYFVQARDAGDRLGMSGVYEFDVAYPESAVWPGAVTGLLMRPGTLTNVLVTLTNAGLGPMAWRAEAAFADSFETRPAAWLHGGSNDTWHVDARRARTGSRAWYGGRADKGEYLNRMNAWLQMPPFVVPPGARLALHHWADFERDTVKNGHYWDAAVVELATNGGAEFGAIVPEGGYPFKVTPNDDSPFPWHTPCLGGTGGWARLSFDLSAYAGMDARVRFRFGSDAFTLREGWYIDDVELAPNPYSNAWLRASPPAGVLAGGGGVVVTVAVDTAAMESGDAASFIDFVTDDPCAPTTTVPVSVSVRSPPGIDVLFAAQTGTDGSGRVTVSNGVFDVDWEPLAIEFLVSTNGGAAWTGAVVSAAGALFGAPAVSNALPLVVSGVPTSNALGAATNRLWIEWASTNGPLAGALAGGVLARVRAWDGIYWSGAATSAPFQVDNEPPTAPAWLAVTSHTAGAWSTNARVGFMLGEAGDGAGSGVGGYAYSFSTGAQAAVSGTSAQTAITGPPLPDASDWWLGVRAFDVRGNRGPETNAGPFGIDTLAPSAAFAQVAPVVSAYGQYVVGSTVTSYWTGFADNLSGVAGYYVGLADGGGTTNGAWAAGPPAVLQGTVPDAANMVYVWARDAAGLIGAAAAAPVLVLDPDADYDGDGMRSGGEEIAGTAADDGDSVFALTSLTVSSNGGGGVVLEWTVVSNRVYGVWHRPSMAVTGWFPLAVFSNVPGYAGSAVYTDAVHVVTGRYYRVTVGP